MSSHVEASASRQLLTLLAAGTKREDLLVEIGLEHLKKSVEQQIIRRLDAYTFPSREALAVKEKLESFCYATTSLQDLYRSHEQLRAIILESQFPFLELSIGRYVRFGSYQGEPILWRIANVDGSGDLLLVAENILTLKPFSSSHHSLNEEEDDAEGRFGFNSWSHSSLRTWLNSDQKRVTYDIQSPDKKHVWNGFNSFSREKGFLADGNFSARDRAMIKPCRIKGVVDRVTLLTREILDEFIMARGWDLTTKPTLSAVAQSVFKHSALNPKDGWSYWLKDPHRESRHLVQRMTIAGEISDGYAYDGTVGVRPVLSLQPNLQLMGEGTLRNPFVPTSGQ